MTFALLQLLVGVFFPNNWTCLILYRYGNSSRFAIATRRRELGFTELVKALITSFPSGGDTMSVCLLTLPAAVESRFIGLHRPS